MIFASEREVCMLQRLLYQRKEKHEGQAHEWGSVPCKIALEWIGEELELYGFDSDFEVDELRGSSDDLYGLTCIMEMLCSIAGWKRYIELCCAAKPQRAPFEALPPSCRAALINYYMHGVEAGYRAAANRQNNRKSKPTAAGRRKPIPSPPKQTALIEL